MIKTTTLTSLMWTVWEIYQAAQAAVTRSARSTWQRVRVSHWIGSSLTNFRDFALRYWPAIAVLAVLVLAVAGYAAWPRMTATTATASTGWSRVCVGGVSYLQFTSGASVEWTPAGKVKTCNESGK
jgi:hypothetical protein